MLGRIPPSRLGRIAPGKLIMLPPVRARISRRRSTIDRVGGTTEVNDDTCTDDDDAADDPDWPIGRAGGRC